jgi:hypothetical protein
MSMMPESQSADQRRDAEAPPTIPDSPSLALFLTEDTALNLLKSRDLSAELIEAFCRERRELLTKSRKLKRAIVEHPQTPRHVSLPMLRQLFTFDLLQVALATAVAADLRVAAEESLINRLETISIGEKTTLAKRASGRVAGALLVDADVRVMRAALQNGRVTEGVIVRALRRRDVPASLVEAVCHHPAWSVRHEIRIVLLGNEKTPIDFALRVARTLPSPILRDILYASRLPQRVKTAIQEQTHVPAR